MEKTIEDLIYNRITDSAKLKFDYAEFAMGFEGMPNHVPENFLFGVIAGFASDDSKETVVAKLFNEVLMMGFMVDRKELIDFVEGKEKLFSLEIYVLQLASTMLQNGDDPLGVLNSVNQLLT